MMLRIFNALSILLLNLTLLHSQKESVYTISWDKEKYIVGSSLIALGGAFAIYESRDPLTEDLINTLDPNDVNAFDRRAIFRQNGEAPRISDYFRDGVFLFPFTALLGDQGKKEWKNIGVMYVETVMVNTSLNFLSKYAFYRRRPFVYNPEVPLEEKLTRNASASFYSGHVSHVASLSFFSASILNDFYPNSNLKWTWNSIAIILPAATAYLRYDSGRHFPSDLIVGYAVGGAIGYLIPKMHKSKTNKLTFTLIPSHNSLAVGGKLKF